MAQIGERSKLSYLLLLAAVEHRNRQPIHILGRVAIQPERPCGASAHTPWGNNRVYFDTAECCNAGTRTDQSVDVLDHELDWAEWNHFAFVKKGDTKEICINGERLISRINTSPLPDDFVRLIIGANGDSKAGSHHGLLDDFAVFANALSVVEIAELASGKHPDEIRAIVPIVPEAPSILVALNADGTVTVTFKGVLHSSASVTGVFEPVINATSPHTVPAAAFYLAR